MIYFVQNQKTLAIKVEYGTNPDALLARLQDASPDPLRLVAEVEGDRETERRLRCALTAHRLSPHPGAAGWFRPTAEVLQAMVREREDAQTWGRSPGEPESVVAGRIVAAFLAERTAWASDSRVRVKASALHGEYQAWSASRGRKPMSMRRFGEAIRDMGIGRIECNGVYYTHMRMRYRDRSVA